MKNSRLKIDGEILAIYFKRSFELDAQILEKFVHLKNIRVIYERKRYKIKEN